MVHNGPLVRPGQQRARGGGAQAMRSGRDTHTAEIEPVRIPARLQRGVRIRVTVRVQPAGLVEQGELRVVEMHERTAERAGEVAAALTVAMVAALVEASGIVEECEERDHFAVGPVDVGHTQSVFKHPRPVQHAVISERLERVALENGADDGSFVVRWCCVGSGGSCDAHGDGHGVEVAEFAFCV